MSLPPPLEEIRMRRECRDHDAAVELVNLWKRRWMLALVMLAAILGFGILLTSILRAYSQSHYEYLTLVWAPSLQAGRT